MTERKKTAQGDVLKKLRQFRKRSAGNEGVETPYGHILFGPKENGVPKKSRKGNRNKTDGAGGSQDSNGRGSS
jgi:hypothetical protein